MSRNTTNRVIIICCCTVLLECTGQLNLIVKFLFPCLSPTLCYQFCVLSTLHATLNQRAAASVTVACLGRTCKDSVQLLPLLSETETALQKSGKKKEKGKRTSILNTVHILQAITRTQGHPAFIQCYASFFCTLLLPWELTIYCHQHQTRLREE